MRPAHIAADWLRVTRNRRLAYLVVALVSAVLIWFPQPYVANARIVPQDTSASAASTTSLLGALGSGSQSIGSLLSGGRPSNDLYMVIGRSDSVKTDVVRGLGLVGPDAPFASERKATLWLGRHVDIHLMLGGVMEIETKLYDPDEALRVTSTYAVIIGRHLASFGKQLIINKRGVVQKRYADSLDRVAKAEADISAFRRANRLVDADDELTAGLVERANLDGRLKARQVEYQALSQVRGPDSAELMSARTEIAAMQAQIARTTSPTMTATGPNIAGLTLVQLRYLDLYRNLKFQQAMYAIYQRSAEQVAVEELASESASYIQTIDPAHIDPARHYNIWAIAIFAGALLMALFTEWYAPTTGLMRRPQSVVGAGEHAG